MHIILFLTKKIKAILKYFLQQSHIDETCQKKEVPSKRMALKVPSKKVDDIKSMKEMMEICELLNVVYDQENPNLKEMKKEAKKMIKEQSLNGTTVSVLNSYIIIIYLPN